MKFVALVSGGKDSIYSILECQRLGHTLLACVHLGAPQQQQQASSSDNDTEEEEESYMYQTAASEAITVLVEECIGVPLILHTRKGKSVNTSLVYEHENNNKAAADAADEDYDEVEDLYAALQTAQRLFPDMQAVSSGAILSTYQRVRVEHVVCTRLNLISLAPLWRRSSQHDLLQNMLDDHIEAVLVRTAAPPGLVPHQHLNKTLQELQPLFLKLHAKYQFHVCGEGGEYETLVLNCPGLYKKKLVLDQVEIVLDNDNDDGVGVLRILSCHAQDLTTTNDTDTNGGTMESAVAAAVEERVEDIKSSSAAGPSTSTSPAAAPADAAGRLSSATTPTPTLAFTFLPHVYRVSGGLWHVSEIVSPFVATAKGGDDDEAHLAVQEALQVFAVLAKLLKRHDCTAQDVLYVHLYLSDLSHFARINQHYQTFFGTLLPPSRSCVGIGVGVGRGRRVMMDCLVQCGSGEYLRNNNTTTTSPSILNPYASAALANNSARLREVLHVQSISHWAPVCVGPYSQANTYRSCVHFLAGQIGLQPSTMTLRGCDNNKTSWMQQLEQAWTSAASVLDALQTGKLEHMLSGLVYVESSIFHTPVNISLIQSICSHQRKTNAGVCTGAIDGIRSSSSSSSSSDVFLGSSAAKKKVVCPLLLVAIPEMPVGALTEVEIIAATSEAAACLTIKGLVGKKTTTSTRGTVNDDERQLGYATGHDFCQYSSSLDNNNDSGDEEVVLDCRVVSMADGAVVCAVATASIILTDENNNNTSMTVDLDCGSLLRSMLTLLVETTSAGAEHPPLQQQWLHLRLYYVATIDCDGRCDDGIAIRDAFHSAVASACCYGGGGLVPPATTVVPVNGIRLLLDDGGGGGGGKTDDSSETTTSTTAFAIQALMIDPVGAETELWIHRGRCEG